VANGYSDGMLARRVRTDGFIDPCIPTLAAKPPAGPDWVHEIKHDGYRLIVRRDGDAVHLFTRRGYDWTDRYPAIAAAAGKLRAQSFTVDGEAVVVGADGVAVFDALHRRHKVSEAPGVRQQRSRHQETRPEGIDQIAARLLGTKEEARIEACRGGATSVHRRLSV
jgi:ATP-dependent DNA ligase